MTTAIPMTTNLAGVDAFQGSTDGSIYEEDEADTADILLQVWELRRLIEESIKR